MLSEILKKKGYRFFRDYPFIDREEEIKFLKEFFEDNVNAFIAVPDDYKSFASKIDLVIERPEFANRVGLNGYKLGKEVFNYKAYTENFRLFILK